MKRIRRQRGFTLVEIMIVVAIIALLAAIAIPNVLRGRVTANETAAIGNVRALISSLEMYRSVYQAYPDLVANWQADLYTGITPAYGPPPFNVPMTGAATSVVQGFRYLYTPVGAAPVQSYSVRAVPDTTSTGTRSIFGSGSGQLAHCVGTSATTTIPTSTIDQPPVNPCP